MKVKDLIKKLKTMDPNAIVITTSDNYELKGSSIEVTSAYQSDEGSSRKKGFYDDFDGGSYDKTVYSTVGGKMKIVRIS